MSDVRTNKSILVWVFQKGNRLCKNWVYIVTEKFKSLNCEIYCNMFLRFSKEKLKSDVMKALKDNYILNWEKTVNAEVGQRQGHNKLRTYKLFKTNYIVEPYCKIILPLKHRSAFAKFRCGVAPLRIETGRYEQLEVNDRKCPFCSQDVETELHALLKCKEYVNIRNILFEKASSLESNFRDFTDIEKLKFLFSNEEMIRSSAKTCYNILQKRNNLLYK